MTTQIRQMKMIKKLITAALAFSFVLSAVTVMKVNTVAANLVITLDPGHGEGKSADGSTGSGTAAAEAFGGVNELYYNLDISLYTRERLLQYSGVDVYMTREVNDFTPGLKERVDIAKSHNSDAIISIHNNMNPNPDAYGSQIYIPNENYRPDMAVKSKVCAQKIMAKLNKDAGTHKNANPYSTDSADVTYPDGSAADKLRVIRYAKEEGIEVAMIVECAFLSNRSDYEKHFTSDEAIKKLGYAIADGIASFYGLDLKDDGGNSPESDPPLTDEALSDTAVTEGEPESDSVADTADTAEGTEQSETQPEGNDSEEKSINKNAVIISVSAAIFAIAAAALAVSVIKSKNRE